MGLQDQEYEWFEANLRNLSPKYAGKHLVIKDNSVIGDYTSFAEACEETLTMHQLGTFIIQECPEVGKSIVKVSLSSFASK